MSDHFDGANLPNWTRIGSRQKVYENQYQQVYRVMTTVAGSEREYFVTDYSRRAGVVAVNDGSVLLVRQYRLFLDALSWELPGGRVENGETPEQAAIRECVEETGMRCADLQALLMFHPGLDTLHNPSYLYSTTHIADTGHRPRNREVTEHDWVPLRRCFDMIAAGQILDSISILGLLAYRTFRMGES